MSRTIKIAAVLTTVALSAGIAGTSVANAVPDNGQSTKSVSQRIR